MPSRSKTKWMCRITHSHRSLMEEEEDFESHEKYRMYQKTIQKFQDHFSIFLLFFYLFLLSNFISPKNQTAGRLLIFFCYQFLLQSCNESVTYQPLFWFDLTLFNLFQKQKKKRKIEFLFRAVILEPTWWRTVEISYNTVSVTVWFNISQHWIGLSLEIIAFLIGYFLNFLLPFFFFS